MTLSDEPESRAGIDAWIAACLRHAPGAARAVPPADPAVLVHRVVYHGLAGQFAGDRGLMAALPGALAQGLQDAARGQAFQELAHRRLLVRLAAAFSAAGIEPLVLKGTALAYSVYDRPAGRPRGDTDLLVAEADYPRAARILEAEGLALAFAPAGQVVSSQCAYVLYDAHGLEHTIDLHRQTNNHAALAALFTYPELRAQAVPLDRLAPGLWRPGLVDALLFACCHRYMHVDAPITVAGVDHLSENRLVWLLDMVRIGQRLAPDDWEVLVARARGRGLLRICRGALLAARDLAGLGLPAAVAAALESAPADEAPMRFLRAGRGGRLRANLAATPGIRHKARFLAETAFPPAAYMRAQFGRGDGGEGLARLYLRRALGGLAKLARSRGIAP